MASGGTTVTYDYYGIQQLAKMYKKRSSDFVTLSMDNDPYYMVGNPSATREAKWFKEIYEHYWHRLTDPLVRSLHYAILHQPVYLSDGKTRYTNLQEHY